MAVARHLLARHWKADEYFHLLLVRNCREGGDSAETEAKGFRIEPRPEAADDTLSQQLPEPIVHRRGRQPHALAELCVGQTAVLLHQGQEPPVLVVEF